MLISLIRILDILMLRKYLKAMNYYPWIRKARSPLNNIRVDTVLPVCDTPRQTLWVQTQNFSQLLNALFSLVDFFFFPVNFFIKFW